MRAVKISADIVNRYWPEAGRCPARGDAVNTRLQKGIPAQIASTWATCPTHRQIAQALRNRPGAVVSTSRCRRRRRPLSTASAKTRSPAKSVGLMPSRQR